MRAKRLAAVVGAVLMSAGVATSSRAAVIKLTLGETGPDVAMNQAGVLSTVDDGIFATVGRQNTSIDFVDGLDFIPDRNFNGPLDGGSFSLDNVLAVGPANVFGSLVVQNFVGGTFNLFDSATNGNVLLLSGALTNTVLTGTVGGTGTGSLFTTTFATVTGGTLAPLFVPGTMSLSMEMTRINGGTGLVVGAAAPILQAFAADATLSIDGTLVPEPASALALLAMAPLAMFRRRAK